VVINSEMLTEPARFGRIARGTEGRWRSEKQQELAFLWERYCPGTSVSELLSEWRVGYVGYYLV